MTLNHIIDAIGIEPYYREDAGVIYNADCLDILPKMPEKCVDLALTDPPYGITDCEWDAVVDLSDLWKQLQRVIKEKSAMVFTAAQPFTTTLIASNAEQFRHCWVWVKTKASGHLFVEYRPLRQHEDIAVFSCQAHPAYYPQGLKKGKYKTGRNVDMTGKVYSNYKNHGVSELGNYPKSVLYFDNPSGAGHLHPTQKPIALMAYLIKTYSHEDHIIIDPFAGSGTTGIAAKESGRKFILIEIEKKYCDIARQRLAQEILI